MIYVPSLKLAYHHLHKTGGISFTQGLRSLFPDCIELEFDSSPHGPLPYFFGKLRELGAQPDQIDILTLIRDPLHHMVSIYHYWRQSGDPNMPFVHLAKELPFRQFVLRFVAIAPGGRMFHRTLFVDNHIPPNVRLLRLESWRADLERLNYSWAARLQLPHLNASKHEAASTYYDAQTIQLIRDHYAWIYDKGLYPDPFQNL